MEKQSIEEFVFNNLKLIDLEQNEELNQSKSYQQKLSLLELQNRGICLTKLYLLSVRTGLYGRTVATFGPKWSSKQLPSNGITNGDVLGITRNNSSQIDISGVVLKVESNGIDVAFDGDTSALIAYEDNVWYNLIKLSNDITYRRLKYALNCLKKNSFSHKLIQTLFGEIEIICDSNEFQIQKEFKYFNTNLNESQKSAIEFAINQKDIAIIHGPPGTGKTTTLIEFILQCVKNYDLRVLACAPSNVAVDNILEKLSIVSNEQIVRLGHPARAFAQLQKYSLDAAISRSDEYKIVCDMRAEIEVMLKQRMAFSDIKSLRKELKVREKKVMRQVLSQSKVVLSTLTSGSPDGPLKQLLDSDGYYSFDVVVIDECSQALEASAWIVLNCAHKCILAGDHMQLPPTIISEKAAKEGLEVSLMERLIKEFEEKRIVRMLDIQYRMNENIMNWTSNQFYSNQLKAYQSVKSHTLNDIIEGSNICPLVLIDTAGCDMNELDLEDEESKGNEFEADIVSVYVERLVKKGFAQNSIGIISPYNLQVQLLRARLKHYQNIEIKSVDGFQGREKEIIILSLVRSNDRHEVGFLSESRRINVAVTRARRHLVVVCDTDTVCSDTTIKSLIDHLHQNGDIVCAQEFCDEMQNFAQIKRPINLRFKTKESISVGVKKENKFKTKPKSDLPVNRLQITENDSKTKEKEKEFEEKLQQFVATNDCNVFSFPTLLTSFERLLIHKIAESLDLIHESVGEGNDRYIVIKKKHLNAENSSESTSNDNKNKVIKTKPNFETKIENKTNFSNECNKNVNKIEKNKTNALKDESKVKKEKNKTKSEKNIKSLTLPEDEDIDSLIAKVKKADNTCSFGNCKTNISVLGQKCQFCGHRFCLTHSMPEIHGCGDLIKAFVKSNIRKENKLYPGSGLPEKKKTDSIKRNYLEKKLTNKLNDLSNERKSKTSNKK